MLKLFSLTVLLLFTLFCSAQGSWNIGYLEIDSINKNHLGKIVRIDFKSTDAWTSSEGLRHIRSYVQTEDTGTITVEKELLILAERRKIYVDHGSYSQQYLECINCRQEPVFIYDAKIASLDNQTITFQVDLETKRKDRSVIKETKTVTIDRNKLDGVMYKED